MFCVFIYTLYTWIYFLSLNIFCTVNVHCDPEYILWPLNIFLPQNIHCAPKYTLCPWVYFVPLNIHCVPRFILCSWIYSVPLNILCTSAYILWPWIYFVLLNIFCASWKYFDALNIFCGHFRRPFTDEQARAARWSDVALHLWGPPPRIIGHAKTIQMGRYRCSPPPLCTA